jgi:hypothetical protein
MYLLQLAMPCLAFLLYGLSATFAQPRIELFMVLCWSMFLIAVGHAVCLIVMPGSLVTVVLHFVVLGLLVIGGIWNLLVCIGQVTQDLGYALRNFIMLACVVVAIYSLVR